MDKLCDVLFKIKHVENSPSVVIPGDNLKIYFGDKIISLESNQDTSQNNSEVQCPEIQNFTAEQGVKQDVVRVNEYTAYKSDKIIRGESSKYVATNDTTVT